MLSWTAATALLVVVLRLLLPLLATRLGLKHTHSTLPKLSKNVEFCKYPSPAIMHIIQVEKKINFHSTHSRAYSISHDVSLALNTFTNVHLDATIHTRRTRTNKHPKTRARFKDRLKLRRPVASSHTDVPSPFCLRALQGIVTATGTRKDTSKDTSNSAQQAHETPGLNVACSTTSKANVRVIAHAR